jgi:prepilin-type N-terminal cleavage/methylation domain-containing protein
MEVIRSRKSEAFTLIELLVVITIIVILMGLLFPAFRGVQDQAKKTQAKNDLTQIITAINAYYTEYGKYPLGTQGADVSFKTANNDVINTLRAIASGANASDALNPRKIVFFSPPDVKDANTPRAGVDSAGVFYDPWGKKTGNAEAGIYHLVLDGDYDNQIANPYTNAGSTSLRLGVIAWSLGTDQNGGSGDKKSGGNVDDVLSWQ